MTKQRHNAVQAQQDDHRKQCSCLAKHRQRARLEALALDVFTNSTRHEEPEEWRQ